MNEVELKEKGIIPRLTNATFKFDSRIKEGWYSAEYFIKAKKIVEENAPNHIVTMQFFQRSNNTVLCGIDEAIALVKTFANNPSSITMEALNDGDIIKANEPVLKITGHYQDFGFLESVIDGVLSRRSSVATNVYNVLKVASPSKVFFMADRQDSYVNQQGDGYAAYIGGLSAQCTMAQEEWWGVKGSGTMPHALIQIMNGDIIEATRAYLNSYPNEKITPLVDFNNDVINDALKVCREFKNKVEAVRVDTSINMIDHYFDDKKRKYNGVNPTLIKALRKALDDNGFNKVKIVVSSGFDVDKVKEFKKKNVPVDAYGIGTSLLKINIGFTGDLVRLDGKMLAKQGRKDIPSKRLKKVA